MMELVVRKMGNSLGLTFPTAILRDLGISAGQSFEMKKGAAGTLVLRPKKISKKYTAAELNAQCNLKAPMPDDLLSWDSMQSVGSESL
jgi:antitoxin ChpS